MFVHIFQLYFRLNLETMLMKYCKPFETADEKLLEAQSKAINDVVQELVRQLYQPNTCVREQVCQIFFCFATWFVS